MHSKFLKSSAFFLTCLCFVLCTITACKKERQAQKMPAEISSYLYAYTSGTISKAAPIRVRFTNSVAETDQIGQAIPPKVLNFDPSINGTAVWEDDRTILFEPEDWLESKTTYIAKVKLGQLFDDVPANVSSFEFDFRTKDQYLDVSVAGLEPEDITDLKTQILKGTVYTSDVANAEKVEAVLTASQGGTQLPIRWEHRNNQRDHQFFVERVNRGKDDSEVLLKWNASSFNKESKGEKKVNIPSINNFQLMDARVAHQQDQFIELHFSDPVKKSQNLEGLISIENVSGRLRFVVDRNIIRVYPKKRLNGEQTVKVRTGVKNIAGIPLQKMGEWKLLFESLKPQLKLAGKGVIMPNSDGLIFPFEAVGLSAVHIEIFKIFDSNILQFLQTNSLDQHYELERVGQVLMQKKLALQDLNPKANTNTWGRYAVDLKSLIDQDPNAIYQVRLGFIQNDATYPCTADNNGTATDDLTTVVPAALNSDGDIESIWDDSYYYYEGYRWSHRKDPCYPAYYRPHNFVRRNVLASNLGLIAKKGTDGNLFVAASDLRTTEPIANVQLDFYNYAQQLIRTVYTNADGIANIELEQKPFIVVASSQGQKGYLRLLDPNALPLSRFDVAGTKNQKGLKGFLYGERGVWRPGDSLYLNFVLEDKAGKLPANHPLQFELYDARGQLQQKFTTSENVNNVYPLNIATSPDAPTGNWRAVVKAGGATFNKNLKIETVKPNRLKIDLDFGKESLGVEDKDLLGDLQVNWLHGAPAQNLKAKVEVQVKSVRTKFPKFNEYVFDDPARRFAAEPQVIFDGQVDAAGKAKVKAAVNTSNAAPGRLSANFKSRAFEQGGDFSIDNFSMPYHPYETYVGVYIPENKYKSKRLIINEESAVDFAAVDQDGKALSNRSLKVGLYRVDWRWWWDRDGYEDLSRYNSNTHRKAISSANLQTNQRGEVQWNVKVEEWGRYLIRVCDEASGHCSGDFFYAGSPWYSDGQNRDAAAMLYFTTDKTAYKVGETIELTVPASDVGRCLISLETGSKVLESYWKDTKAGDNTYRFYATEEMAPTVYAHVTLVQPHAQVENDLPIRMYGVVPIKVENPKNKLEPELKMAKVLEPKQKVQLEVKEKNGRPMAYTIAMVDEGLLDLTRFKTPNPLDVFYAREALGVNTWDVYDQVLGAYGGELERILSIGGDGEIVNPTEKKNANRFKPVVNHLGPFYLKKGGKAKHEIVMPNYVGSVRTMLVASDNGAYGMTEKTTPVRKPLMILATLPRVLGPTESLQMPVNVFAMEDKVKNVTVSIEEQSGLVDILGGNTQSVSFNQPGDELLFFNIDVKEKVGIARFKITAKGGGEVATQEIEIDIRNPNPRVTEVADYVIEAGQSWNSDYQAIGMKGTNKSILELSNIPPLNLGERLDYLIRYPHGCVEQTTSSGFPQLYVNSLLKLEEADKAKVTRNINATIERLRNFQRSTGDFAYWPGQNYVNEWGTNYAGHFLLEASKLGYEVSQNVLDRWVKAQRKMSREWQYANRRYSQYTQAYRLYTLALANEPEWGAMNRLREANSLKKQAAWRLAAAYAVAGKPDVAKEITKSLGSDIEAYTELGGSYGTPLRDQAMILETLTHLGERQKAGEQVQVISNMMSRKRWYSTQTTAYCLLAIGKFVGGQDRNQNFTFTYQLGGEGKVEAGAETPMMQIQLPVDKSSNRNFSITNTNNSVLFARLISSGQPVVGDQTSKDNNLVMDIQYKSMNGKKLDPSNIMQGTDFVAEVSVRNPGKRGIRYEEMALSQIFPSGWEIHNSRMDGIQAFSNTSKAEYQDIRDDRVYTYFDLKVKQKETYRIQLNAAYQGRFYLPSVYCEAMYDNTISSQKPGTWVNVVPPNSM